MTSARAFAKINLGLVVGPTRPDGKHEVATVVERVGLHDLIELERVDGVEIDVEGVIYFYWLYHKLLIAVLTFHLHYLLHFHLVFVT